MCPVEAIKLADLDEGFGVGSPYIDARSQACDFSCDGLQCVLACPTGSLTHDINYPAQTNMGVAKLVQPKVCLATHGKGFKGAARGADFKGILRFSEVDRWNAIPLADHPFDLEICDLCVRLCPIEIRANECEAGKPPAGDENQCPPKRAIQMVAIESADGVNRMQPEVLDGCVGCGVCEMVCPTSEAAIVIETNENRGKGLYLMGKLVESLSVLFGNPPSRPDKSQFSEEVTELHKHKKFDKARIAAIHKEIAEKIKLPQKWRRRRWAVLITVNLLFVLSYWLDISVLEGALTASRFVGFHMADLNSALQVMLAYKTIVLNLVIGTVTVFVMWWLLGGRTFCSWICPYHLVAEWAEMLHLKLVDRGWAKDHAFDRRTRTWFWLIFGALALISGYTVLKPFPPPAS